MRITKLEIGEFKNLRNFQVDFNPEHAISVVVGRNGTGKSNLLEALTIIFRDLDLGARTAFGYRLQYQIRDHDVSISNSITNDDVPKRVIAVDRKRSSMEAVQGRRKTYPRLLPDFVFGYYSGPTNRLERHYKRHRDAYNRALRDGIERPLRRLFYAQPAHSQFVLLAFFLSNDPSTRSFLQKYLRIEGFESATFVVSTPPWVARSGGDSRFWNARGVVADLLGTLYEISLAPMRLEVSADIGGRRRREERLYLYLPDEETFLNLAERYENSPQALFSAFESVLAADLLSEVRVRVRARGVDGSLTFRELSEGEQQLLMVLGLLRFTRESESLFLLDEPDTHLNPAWSVDYAEMLTAQTDSDSDTSQIIMATHDPLVIASLLRSQVTILERDDQSGVVTASHPETDPQGMGVSALLTSEVYGLPSELDPITYRKLERRRWLATADELNESERVELASLTHQLESLDFNLSERDPLFTRFEQALARNPPSADDEQDVPAIKVHDDEILRRLRSLLELGHGGEREGQ